MTDSPTRPLRMIRLPEVAARTGMRKSTIYLRVAEGSFPRPVKLGPNVSAWVEEEVERFLLDRLAERDAAA